MIGVIGVLRDYGSVIGSEVTYSNSMGDGINHEVKAKLIDRNQI